MYSLTILMKCVLQENKSNNIYNMINNVLYDLICHITSNNLSQIYKQYLCSIILLFVVLYNIRYDLYNCFWYFRRSIIDTYTLKKIVHHVTFFREKQMLLHLYILRPLSLSPLEIKSDEDIL